MTNGKAVFFLRTHNEADQIIPIVYKLARRGRADIDVVLSGIEPSDYRIELIRGLNPVTVHGGDEEDSAEPPSQTLRNRTIDHIKQVGRRLPTRLPEAAYHRLYSTPEDVEHPSILDSLTEGYEDVVILVDWTKAKEPGAIPEFAERNGYTTVVLPHGDSPFQNGATTERTFERLIDNDACFQHQHDPFVFTFSVYEDMADHDYVLMPNELTARRITSFMNDDQVRVFGSPRYNTEWLNILSDTSPEHCLEQSAKWNIVLFVRPKKYFISEQAVRDTVRLVTAFPDVHVIIKEHPRHDFFSTDTSLQERDNCEIVSDEIESAALTEWGDVFLSVGTSITFEPVMKGKPVLALEYTHANYSSIAHYFSNADLRSKDDLYRAMHSIRDDSNGFYESNEYQQFVEEMITAGNDSVLEAYAKFIETQLEADT
jgi:hypothetical protein